MCNLIFSKTTERLRRKAIGPVKWQPVATYDDSSRVLFCYKKQHSFIFTRGLRKPLELPLKITN